MRLFLGLSIPPAIRQELAARVEQMKKNMPATTWVPAENWHITLLFLGEVTAGTAEDLRRRFAEAARRTSPFSLRLQDWGAFPDARRAKILWAGVAGEREPLARLAQAVQEAAAGLIPVETGKPFVPHITLTRKAPVSNVIAFNDRWPLRTKEWQVQQMHLYISHLAPRGARYEIWESYPFGRSVD